MTDGYKTSHHNMYPKGTTLVYSNFTPRNVKYMDKLAKDIVVFGIQYTMMYIHDLYQENFFNRDKEDVIGEAKKYYSSYLGTDYNTSHFEALHDLGYLPINVKALKEGTIIKEKIPILTIYNTHPEFFWLPNFLETLLSSLLWKPLHSASVSFGFRKILNKYANETDVNNLEFVNFQGHDFSFRGMQHPESAISSGMGFLVSFFGTDTVPTLLEAEYYYGAVNAGFSVPASEHSVMTAYGKEDEIEGFKRIIDLYPSGIVSVVSDSFDLWAVCTKFVTELKEKILARDGKLVIRPDSGDPVDIICGSAKIIDFGKEVVTLDILSDWAKDYLEDQVRENTDHGECGDSENVGYFLFDGKIYKITIDIEWNRYGKQYYFIEESKVISCEEYSLKSDEKGVIELLWDVFGGTINEQGYKVLDSHIGVILGDGVTLERAEQICERLKQKGFASTNIVLGIGSYSMGYCTRDNQGSAMKATYVELTKTIFDSGVGETGTMERKEIIGREIFKDPITDDGTKKSATGLLRVVWDQFAETHQLLEKQTWEEENDENNQLKLVYKNGEFFNKTTLNEIREKLKYK